MSGITGWLIHWIVGVALLTCSWWFGPVLMIGLLDVRYLTIDLKTWINWLFRIAWAPLYLNGMALVLIRTQPGDIYRAPAPTWPEIMIGTALTVAMNIGLFIGSTHLI